MMNRLEVSRDSSNLNLSKTNSLQRADAAHNVSSGTFSRSTADCPQAFLSPLHYEPNYAYPLIVWLHGPGRDEGQLKRIMPCVSLRNYVSTSIRGTAASVGGAGGASAGGEVGFTWLQSELHVNLAEHRLFSALETAQVRFNISPRRIFLAGIDCGGTMAFRLAMNHPTRFAGVLSIGGEFPVGGAPLARISDARSVPIFLATGRDSQRYPAAAVCNNLKLLHSAGMDVTLRQYPCGHELWPQMLADMDRWIMELVVGSAGAG
jgi:phospholipase/carboxylesterase